MRLCLFGGSFNPPHLGHQMVILWLLSSERADRVYVVPTYQHAFQKNLVGFDHRVAMCECLAPLFCDKRVIVSRIEEEIGGESRTVVTLEALAQRKPHAKLSYVIGSDLVEEMPMWYRHEDLASLAEPIVVPRPGYPAEQSDRYLFPPISSSDIRQRLAAGEAIDALVPASVHRYIAHHRLYEGSNAS